MTHAIRIHKTGDADQLSWDEISVGDPGPGEPYISDLMLSDIGTSKCDWSESDISAFREWQYGDKNQAWMERKINELREIIKTTPPKLPKNLHGIGEPDW